MHADRSSFEAYLKFLAEAASDGTPQVLETQHALSLHFD
ncbi:spermidine synthase, partial [Cupriavidus necator]